MSTETSATAGTPAGPVRRALVGSRVAALARVMAALGHGGGVARAVDRARPPRRRPNPRFYAHVKGHHPAPHRRWIMGERRAALRHPSPEKVARLRRALRLPPLPEGWQEDIHWVGRHDHA